MLSLKTWKKCYLAHQFEGSQQVVGEDGGPAHEEDRHDQDQHVDHLGHHDDDDFGGEKDVDDDQAEEEDRHDQDQHVDHLDHHGVVDGDDGDDNRCQANEEDSHDH